MDVKVLTLSDFLLARIMEDEAAVNSRTRHLALGGWSYLEQFGDFGDDERWMIEVPAARVLAECEAKRRIVAAADAAAAEPEGGIWPPRVHMTGMADGLQMALRLLALPFADHPDYREEWRP